MKLNSKSGATLAAAAATLFLAGSVVSTVSTPANAAQGKCMAGNACKGPERLQGRGQRLQGPERLQGSGLLGHDQGEVRCRQGQVHAVLNGFGTSRGTGALVGRAPVPW